MKKLSLLNKVLPALLVLASCSSPSSKSNIVTDSETGKNKSGQSIDSLTESANIRKTDSIKQAQPDANKSGEQQVEGSKLHPQNGTQYKSTIEKRAIKHGSDEQAKLDSIKKAKEKIKY